MLSTDEVKHIAMLSRIGMKEDDVEKYRKDLSAILDFFQELEKLDTSTVALMGNITGKQDASRTDIVEEIALYDREVILRNAPEKKDGFVKVKSVF